MKVSELRIGNFIYNAGYLSKVIGFKPFSRSVRCDEEEGCNILIDVYLQDGSVKKGYEIESYLCKPIPLTEEKLLKWGFECGTDFLEFKINEGLSIIWVGYLAIMIDGSISFLPNQDKLHNLQNLHLALTQRELPIKT